MFGRRNNKSETHNEETAEHIIQSADEKNRNGRYYPTEVLNRALSASYSQPQCLLKTEDEVSNKVFKSICYSQSQYLLKTEDEVLFIIDDALGLITAIDLSKANWDTYTKTTVHNSLVPDIDENNKLYKQKMQMLYDCIIKDRENSN